MLKIRYTRTSCKITLKQVPKKIVKIDVHISKLNVFTLTNENAAHQIFAQTPVSDLVANVLPMTINECVA